MSEELDRDFLLTETLKNLVGQHAINLKHFSRVTLVSNKIEKLFEIEELNRDFLLNTSNWNIEKLGWSTCDKFKTFSRVILVSNKI